MTDGKTIIIVLYSMKVADRGHDPECYAPDWTHVCDSPLPRDPAYSQEAQFIGPPETQVAMKAYLKSHFSRGKQRSIIKKLKIMTYPPGHVLR